MTEAEIRATLGLSQALDEALAYLGFARQELRQMEQHVLGSSLARERLRQAERALCELVVVVLPAVELARGAAARHDAETAYPEVW